jgi:Gene product 88
LALARADAIATSRATYQHNIISDDLSGYAPALLKPAKYNKKTGNGQNVWTRGPFKGLRLYQLTLEERATCDRACNAWDNCYGNNMPFAHRFNPLGIEKAFTRRLSKELDALDRKHAEGYSIRLHILGDFYSVAYVNFWAQQLTKRPLLKIYGYTHRRGEIAEAITKTFTTFPGRFVIMQSDGKPGIRPIALLETTPGADTLPLCPVQSKKASSCLSCGLCANQSIRGVRFELH